MATATVSDFKLYDEQVQAGMWEGVAQALELFNGVGVLSVLHHAPRGFDIEGLVVEIGAGTAIPTVRLFGEHLGAPLIRINPTESRISANRGISLPINGTQAARGIAAALIDTGFLDSPEG